MPNEYVSKKGLNSGNNTKSSDVLIMRNYVLEVSNDIKIQNMILKKGFDKLSLGLIIVAAFQIISLFF